MKNLEKVKNKSVKAEFEKSNKIIKELNIPEEDKNNLLSTLQDTIDRHISIEENYSISIMHLVNLDKVQKRNNELMKNIRDLLINLNRELTSTESLLRCKEKIEA